MNITADWGAEPLDISSSIYTATRPNPGDDAGVHAARRSAPAGGGRDRLSLAVAQALARMARSASSRVRRASCRRSKATRSGTARRRRRRSTSRRMRRSPRTRSSRTAARRASIPSATLLLPVSSWDTGYVAVAPADFGRSPRLTFTTGRLQIVANEDDTKVSMRPTVDIAQGRRRRAGGCGRGRPKWNLSTGSGAPDHAARLAVGQPHRDEQAGRHVRRIAVHVHPGAIPRTATRPSSRSRRSPSGARAYALVPYRSRLSGTQESRLARTCRGASSAPSTAPCSRTIPREPPGAPETLAAGEVATFMTDALVTVKSQDTQHPFHAVGLHDRRDVHGGSGAAGQTLGDPEFVSVVPSDSSSIATSSSPTTPSRRRPSRWSVERQRRGFMPVKLDVRRRGHRLRAARHERRVRVRLGAAHYRVRPADVRGRDVRLRPARGDERRAVLDHRLGIGQGRELRLRRRHGEPTRSTRRCRRSCK